MDARHTRLAAALAAAWEAEVVSGKTLVALAEVVSAPAVRGRLMVLAAFCRAHASRLLARLSAMGRGPLPVPPDEVWIEGDLAQALGQEAEAARASAKRYGALAEVARAQADYSSAWVCELNSAEEEDRANELSRLCQGELRQGDTALYDGLELSTPGPG
jgi:hypothetical protein